MNQLGVMTAIGSVTARALAGRRRTLLMLLLAFAPVLLGVIIRLGNGGPRPNRLEPALEGLIVTSVMPLVALVLGTAALGSELDDGTAVHIITKPIPRWAIMLPKLIVAGVLSAGLLFVSTILSGTLIGGLGQEQIQVTVAFAIGVVVGSFVYVAIFLALSAATSRGLIIGLGYVLLWEGLLAGALPGTQLLSVREYVNGIVSALAPPEMQIDSIVGSMGFLYAVIALIVVMVLGTLRLAVYEVRSID